MTRKRVLIVASGIAVCAAVAFSARCGEALGAKPKPIPDEGKNIPCVCPVWLLYPTAEGCVFYADEHQTTCLSGDAVYWTGPCNTSCPQYCADCIDLTARPTVKPAKGGLQLPVKNDPKFNFVTDVMEKLGSPTAKATTQLQLYELLLHTEGTTYIPIVVCALLIEPGKMGRNLPPDIIYVGVQVNSVGAAQKILEQKPEGAQLAANEYKPIKNQSGIVNATGWSAKLRLDKWPEGGKRVLILSLK